LRYSRFVKQRAVRARRDGAAVSRHGLARSTDTSCCTSPFSVIGSTRLKEIILGALKVKNEQEYLEKVAEEDARTFCVLVQPSPTKVVSAFGYRASLAA